MLLDKNKIKNQCIPMVKKAWLSASDSFPEFINAISNETQTLNEQNLRLIIEKFKLQLQKFPINPRKREKWKQMTLRMFKDFLYEETFINVHDYMDHQEIDLFQEELKEFFHNARKFSPELSIEGVGQAARNYMVYAMFNEINHNRKSFSAPAFGYSMLYPFTDNYIDSIEYSDSEKEEFNQIIRDKIEGREVHTESSHHNKTCELLQMIEMEYPREDDPTVSNLLIMMLEAQEESLRQHDKEVKLSLEERLDISLYKGGISVLIDRYFVDKEVTEEDLVFYFGFGFLLQLTDDLQDIREDIINENQTILTLVSNSEMNLNSDEISIYKREKIVNKMFHFVHLSFRNHIAEDEEFKKFVLSNCYQLIYFSVYKSREYFSNEYMNQLSEYLPVNYQFIENMKINEIKKPDGKLQEKYLKILDELIS